MTHHDADDVDVDTSPVNQFELETILEAFNCNNQTDEQEFRLVFYVMDELTTKNGYEPTEDEVCARMSELITGHTLRCMVNKGVLEVLIDESGEESFILSDLGKQLRKELTNVQ